jgi:hypothetical protein
MSQFKSQVSLHGLRAYITRLNSLVAEKAFVAGGEKGSIGRSGGNVVLPGSPGVVAVWQDFLGHIADTGAFNGWEFVNGDNDTGATGGVNFTSAVNGVVRLNWATSAQPGVAHNVGISTNAMKNWKANAGNLRFAARVKIPSLTAVQAYIGFSDSGGADMPAYDTGTNAAIGFLSNMTDGVGFLYSQAGGVTTWRGVATKGDSDQAMTASVSTVPSPTANVYDVLEVQLSQDSGQRADFFINGLHVGKIDNPLDAAVALAPGAWLCGTDTGTIQLDVDWMNISANRDSGT